MYCHTTFFFWHRCCNITSLISKLAYDLCSFGCKEIELNVRNARLVRHENSIFSHFCDVRKNVVIHFSNGLQKTMEAFLIILSATQLFYIAAIHGAAAIRR